MPNNKPSNANATHAFAPVLKQAGLLLDHQAFANKSVHDKYPDVLAEIQEELRTLQAGLTEVDPCEVSKVAQYSSDKHTVKRLSNITSLLTTLLEVCNNADALKQAVQPKHKKWDTYATSSQHNLVLEMHIHHLRTSSRYTKDFINFLGLESLIQRQNKIDAKLKAAIKAKELLENTANTAGKIDSLVSTTKAAIVSGDHAAVAAAAAANTAGTAVSQAAPILKSLLQAMPLVGSIMSAISAITQTGQSYLKKKGFSDTAIKATTAAVAIAAVGLTIAFPAAAAIIAVITVSASVFSNYIKPYFDAKKQIEASEIKLVELQNREKNLDDPYLKLHQSEKSALSQQLAKYYAKNPHISLELLTSAKQAINDGNLLNISANPLIQKSLGLPPDQKMNDFLKQHNANEQKDMTRLIEKLTGKKKSMAAQTINGGFTIAGAIMICIPVPPVQIAGAALLVASSIAGVCIEYRKEIWDKCKKLGNGIKAFFGVGKESDKTLDNSNNNSLTQKSVHNFDQPAATSSNNMTPVKPRAAVSTSLLAESAGKNELSTQTKIPASTELTIGGDAAIKTGDSRSIRRR
jgi:hypothetical protein